MIRPRVPIRAKTMRDGPGAEFGAKIFVLWEDAKVSRLDGCRRPTKPLNLREALTTCARLRDQNYGYRFALEAKPNESRRHLHADSRRLPGVYNPGLSRNGWRESRGCARAHARTHMTHAGQREAGGKLFHIDLNDQVPGRYDQTCVLDPPIQAAFWS